MTERTCSVEDCSKPLRNRTAALCGMHYHRMYRHGDLNANAQSVRFHVKRGSGYRQVYLPDHPLAPSNGHVYEHRVVLFAIVGAGLHPCHWCGKTVTWDKVKTPNALQVDHLDGDGFNNHPDNLVVSCPGCNTARALQQRHDRLRALGFWSVNDTVAGLRDGRQARVQGEWASVADTVLSCQVCAAEFTGRRGRRYCSELCSVEMGSRMSRERWRREHGLPPLGVGQPTKAWASGTRGAA